VNRQSRRHAIKAAMSIADDVAEGRLQPEELDRVAVEECRALFGTVTGPDNPLWELHLQVTRGVLAAAGIPFGELQQWLAVAKTQPNGIDHKPWPPPIGS
jgi:hypothetical protein